MTFDAGIALSFSGSTNNYEDEVGIILDNLYDVCAIPALPADLKAKKINLKEARAKAEPESEKPNDNQSLLERIEDMLWDEGLIDLEETDDS